MNILRDSMPNGNLKHLTNNFDQFANGAGSAWWAYDFQLIE